MSRAVGQLIGFVKAAARFDGSVVVSSEMEHCVVPTWLPGFVEAAYFTPCQEHEHKNEKSDAAQQRRAKKVVRDYYCVDCSHGPICEEASRVQHPRHNVLQVRKLVRRLAIGVDDIANLVNTEHVQTYDIMRAKIVFLAASPQARLRTGSASYCEWCRRSLRHLVRFCSLSCQLRTAKCDPTAAFDEQKRPFECPNKTGGSGTHFEVNDGKAERKNIGDGSNNVTAEFDPSELHNQKRWSETCEINRKADDSYIYQEQINPRDDGDHCTTGCTTDNVNELLVAFGNTTVSIYLLRVWFRKSMHFVGKRMAITLTEKDIQLEEKIKAKSQFGGMLDFPPELQEDLKNVKDTIKRELETLKSYLQIVCREIDSMIKEYLQQARKDVDSAIERLTENVERVAITAIEGNVVHLDGVWTTAIDVLGALAMGIFLMRRWFTREKNSFGNQVWITLSDDEVQERDSFRKNCCKIRLPRLSGNRQNLESFKVDLRSDLSTLVSHIQQDLRMIDRNFTEGLSESKRGAHIELERIAEAVQNAVNGIAGVAGP